MTLQQFNNLDQGDLVCLNSHPDIPLTAGSKSPDFENYVYVYWFDANKELQVTSIDYRLLTVYEGNPLKF